MSEQRPELGVIAGWCIDEPDAIEDCKRGTHDAVIELLGDRRTGGVGWLIGEPGSTDAVEELKRDETDPALLAHYRHLCALVREHGGRIVLAMAPATP